MPTAKDCHILTSYYLKRYKEKYGTDAIVNRHSARWGFDSVLMDMSGDKAKELLDYYFTTINPKKHSLDGFLYNYEKLQENFKMNIEDAEHRAKLRRESEQRAKEWRERGKQGITNN